MIPEWPMVAAIATLAGFGLSFATFWMMFGRQIGEARTIADDAHRDARDSQDKLTLLSTSFALYREQIARDYVQREMLREFEDRLVRSIQELGQRFDRFMEKVIRE